MRKFAHLFWRQSAQFAVGSQSAEGPFEVGKAEDLGGAMIEPTLGVTDKGGNRCRDTGDVGKPLEISSM